MFMQLHCPDTGECELSAKASSHRKSPATVLASHKLKNSIKAKVSRAENLAHRPVVAVNLGSDNLGIFPLDLPMISGHIRLAERSNRTEGLQV